MQATLSLPIPKVRRNYLGEMIKLFRQSPLALLQRMAESRTPLAMFQAGPRKICLVNDPGLVKAVLTKHHDQLQKARALKVAKFLLGNGLLTSEGNFHKKQRKLVLPAFHHSKIAGYADSMTKHAGRLGQNWQDDAVIRMDNEMARLTLDIVAETLFSTDVSKEGDQIGSILSEALSMFTNIATNPFATVMLKLPFASSRKAKKIRERLDKTIYRFIDEHRETKTPSDDLLTMLMAARDENSGEPMSDLELRDEALTLFLAGHETTAIALTWTWIMLSQHPEVEAKLHAEVDALPNDRPLGFADLKSLTYTRQVLSEVMRLFPPAWAFAREATDDFVLGQYDIKKGTTLVISPWLLHRDGNNWDSPAHFNPERFAPDNKSHHKFAYLPFSAGRRGCIGEQFAWTESLLVIATLAKKYKFRMASNGIPAPDPVFTLRPADEVKMTAVPRTGKTAKFGSSYRSANNIER